MNTEEKLQAIRAKCEELITRDDHRGPGTNILDMPASPDAIAGWRSTIAAIDCFMWRKDYDHVYVTEILTAWGESLQCPCSPELNGICPACQDGMEAAQ